LLCILKGTKKVSRRVDSSRSTVFVRVPSWNVLIPEIYVVLNSFCIIAIKVIHWRSSFQPQKSMHKTASMMLPLITPPKVSSIKLFLYDLLKENLSSLLKVISSMYVLQVMGSSHNGPYKLPPGVQVAVI
jgi:hypothetical protein